MSEKNKSISVKAMSLLLAVVLLVGCAVGGTVAWLLDKTDPIKNTFTVANIDITLTETYNTDTDKDGKDDAWTAKLVPGTEVEKHPVVTVLANSEACWLFVKVEESTVAVTVDGKTYGFKNFINYNVNTEWTLVPSKTNVYYREVGTSTADQPFDVLAGNKVQIPDNVTKAMADALGETTPTLTFTAYAVQKTGFNTAKLAWAEAEKLG